MNDEGLTPSSIAGIVEYFGGYETVARILNVSVRELEQWAAGRSAPPADAFERFLVEPDELAMARIRSANPGV